jgi:hypothetical protein
VLEEMSMTFREAVEYYKTQGIDRIMVGTPEYDNLMKLCGMTPTPFVQNTTVRFAKPGESRQPLNALPVEPIIRKAQSKHEWLKIVENRAAFNAHIQKLKTTS